ncbi:hypothetical protein BV25DRAFT_1843372 [Artomyces pyxidatus]|uniref:Uncharacterized protein n=1 Tax=Artomyces pyxidatus TaxID=48021 RepID=A0ACB8SEG7_9AGAM|nr:hypothetical protein BV25DRAFT_1843372 [Artomyces pyxidatus]
MCGKNDHVPDALAPSSHPTRVTMNPKITDVSLELVEVMTSHLQKLKHESDMDHAALYDWARRAVRLFDVWTKSGKDTECEPLVEALRREVTRLGDRSWTKWSMGMYAPKKEYPSLLSDVRGLYADGELSARDFANLQEEIKIQWFRGAPVPELLHSIDGYYIRRAEIDVRADLSEPNPSPEEGSDSGLSRPEPSHAQGGKGASLDTGTAMGQSTTTDAHTQMDVDSDGAHEVASDSAVGTAAAPNRPLPENSERDMITEDGVSWGDYFIHLDIVRRRRELLGKILMAQDAYEEAYNAEAKILASYNGPPSDGGATGSDKGRS